MNGEAIMALLQTQLQAAMPTRLVTRSALDYAQRQDADCRRGIVTLVADRITGLQTERDPDERSGRLSIYCLAEFRLPENSSGLAVEQYEWAWWEEFKAFLAAPGAGLCPLDVLMVVLSQQRVAPDGFIFLQLEYAELD